MFSVSVETVVPEQPAASCAPTDTDHTGTDYGIQLLSGIGIGLILAWVTPPPLFFVADGLMPCPTLQASPVLLSGGQIRPFALGAAGQMGGNEGFSVPSPNANSVSTCHRPWCKGSGAAKVGRGASLSVVFGALFFAGGLCLFQGCSTEPACN